MIFGALFALLVGSAILIPLWTSLGPAWAIGAPVGALVVRRLMINSMIKRWRRVAAANGFEPKEVVARQLTQRLSATDGELWLRIDFGYELGPWAPKVHRLIRVESPALPVDFRCEGRGLVGSWWRRATGPHRGELELGDEALDRKVRVSGHAADARALLDADARALLPGVLGSPVEAVIQKGAVEYRSEGTRWRKVANERRLTEMVALARSMTRGGEPTVSRLTRVAMSDPLTIVRIRALAELAGQSRVDPSILQFAASVAADEEADTGLRREAMDALAQDHPDVACETCAALGASGSRRAARLLEPTAGWLAPVRIAARKASAALAERLARGGSGQLTLAEVTDRGALSVAGEAGEVSIADLEPAE